MVKWEEGIMHATSTGFSDRLEIVTIPVSAHRTTFAEDVAEGLQAPSKHLSSRFFYDELGSALFDAITYLPEYYLTRAETEILQEWGWEIVRALEEPVEFLELGSGSAMKTRILIEEALRAQGMLRYSPIDISAEALGKSALGLIDTYPKLCIRAYAADYFDALASPQLALHQRVLAMFMGSNIGNYNPSEVDALLSHIAGRLRPGDGLLIGADGFSIGADPAKDRELLEAAYDDASGVTAAFDKNIIGRINRELGGAFDLHLFRHVAVYDEKRHCVDSYLEAQRAHTVRIENLDLDIPFVAGERIHTEVSYKFDTSAIERIARAAGFNLKKTWHDRQKRFGVHLLVKP